MLDAMAKVVRFEQSGLVASFSKFIDPGGATVLCSPGLSKNLLPVSHRAIVISHEVPH